MKELFAEPVWDEVLKFWHRGPADIYVGEEQKSYRALKEYDHYSDVLDIGAHIGWFTRYAKRELNAGFVYAVEPDPNNAKIYRLNHSPHLYGSMISFEEAAIISNGGQSLELQLSHKYPANNRSDRQIQGRKSVRVKTLEFQTFLHNVRTPELLKIDIEGAEYTLDFSWLPPTLRAIAIEYHQFDIGMLEKQMNLHEIFLENGFKAVTKPKEKVTFQKITTGVYLR